MQMYYGVTLEVSSMRGNVYLNHFLGFIVEAPAILGTMFAVSRVGRRSSAAALLLEGESSCWWLCPSRSQLLHAFPRCSMAQLRRAT